jgi:GntR family transcriptional regulator
MPRDVAYRELAASLRRSVLNGEYAEGRRLPTEVELAETHSLSRQTVRRAMQELVSEGVIYRVAGRGTYPVAHSDRYLRQFGSVEDLIGASIDSAFELLTPLQRRVDVAAAGRLRLASDHVMSLTLLRLHDELPFAFNTISISPELGKLLADAPEFATPGARHQTTILGAIEARRPGLVAQCEQSVTAVGAPSFVARHLACEPGDPVMRIDRLYGRTDGEPVELAVSYCDPNRYSYRLNLRRRPS